MKVNDQPGVPQMDVVTPETLLDELTDFLVSEPTPHEIIAFKPPDSLDQRLHELLDKNSAGVLTGSEQAELNRFLEVNHLLILLKAKARLKLRGGT
jgi:hypothetical protein